VQEGGLTRCFSLVTALMCSYKWLALTMSWVVAKNTPFFFINSPIQWNLWNLAFTIVSEAIGYREFMFSKSLAFVWELISWQKCVSDQEGRACTSACLRGDVQTAGRRMSHSPDGIPSNGPPLLQDVHRVIFAGYCRLQAKSEALIGWNPPILQNTANFQQKPPTLSVL
jgi:hypothetical protein